MSNPEYSRPSLPSFPPVEQMRGRSLTDAALLYASCGLPVFPLYGKQPFQGTHGHKDATSDLEHIRAWWSARPFANIGLPTGERTGVIVLDLDPRHATKEIPNPLRVLEERFGMLPPTRTTHTAHNGLHKYFAYPRDGKRYPNTESLAGLPGIDTRGDGGYIILPPSQLFGRLSYQWVQGNSPLAPAPDWLLFLLVAPQRQTPFSPQAQSERVAPHGTRFLEEARRRATPGTRDATGFWLACQLRDDRLSFEEAEPIMLQFADHVPQGGHPFTQADALRTLRSAYSRPPRPPARRSPPS